MSARGNPSDFKQGIQKAGGLMMHNNYSNSDFSSEGLQMQDQWHVVRQTDGELMNENEKGGGGAYLNSQTSFASLLK